MIEATESGTLITGDSTLVAAALSNWYAGHLKLRGYGDKSATRRFRSMAIQSGSAQRTHAGIWVDYTLWLAGYGIEPRELETKAQGVLNKTQFKRLERGLKQARAQAERDREAAR